MARHGVWKVVKSVLKTASRALVFGKKSKQLEACNEANQKQKQKCEEDMRLMKPEFRANDPLYCKDEVVVDAAKRLKKYAEYSGDTVTLPFYVFFSLLCYALWLSNEAFSPQTEKVTYHPRMTNGSMKCNPVSGEAEEEIEFVRSAISEERRAAKNIVMPSLLLESGLIQGMAEVPRAVATVGGSPKVALDPEKKQQKLKE
ncbi:hypothetical protein ACE6H2_013932 [Prunus campanulata]